jgi:hypothetical protein
MNVWHFATQYDAYDASQTSDLIKDGDLLVTPQAVGFLFEAWPVLLKGEADEFHLPVEGVSPDTLGKGYPGIIAAGEAQAFSTAADIEASEAKLYGGYNGN